MEMVYFFLLLLFFAKMGGEIAERLKQPSLVGEVIAGIVLGPSILGMAGTTAELTELLGIGGMLLFFLIGLETKFDNVKNDTNNSIIISVSGQLLSVALIFLSSYYLAGLNYVESVFLAAILSTTSSGVCIRILSDMNKLHTKLGRFLISINLVDDFVGVIIFAVAASIFYGSDISLSSIWDLILIIVGFITVTTAVGPKIVPKVFDMVDKMVVKEAMLSFALIIAFAFSLLANQVGITLTVGAFLAGIIINNSPYMDMTIIPKINTLAYGFFVPLFFANIGLSTFVWSVFNNFYLFALLFFATVVGKMTGSIAACRHIGMKEWDSFLIGSALTPRAEFTIVIGAIGVSSGIITAEIFSTIVVVSVLTSIITPALMKFGFFMMDGNNDESKKLLKVISSFLPKIFSEHKITPKIDGYPMRSYNSYFTVLHDNTLDSGRFSRKENSIDYAMKPLYAIPKEYKITVNV